MVSLYIETSFDSVYLGATFWELSLFFGSLFKKVFELSAKIDFKGPALLWIYYEGTFSLENRWAIPPRGTFGIDAYSPGFGAVC